MNLGLIIHDTITVFCILVGVVFLVYLTWSLTNWVKRKSNQSANNKNIVDSTHLATELSNFIESNDTKSLVMLFEDITDFVERKNNINIKDSDLYVLTISKLINSRDSTEARINANLMMHLIFD